MKNKIATAVEQSKKGCPICTIDGRKSRITGCDCDYINEFPIIVPIEADGQELPIEHTSKGEYISAAVDHNTDLMTVDKKKEGWVNIYIDAQGIFAGQTIYKTKEDAIGKSNYTITPNYITTAKIVWEE